MLHEACWKIFVGNNFTVRSAVVNFVKVYTLDCKIMVYTVLSRVSTHTCASAHPPILAVSVFRVVLRVICGIV